MPICASVQVFGDVYIRWVWTSVSLGAELRRIEVRTISSCCALLTFSMAFRAVLRRSLLDLDDNCRVGRVLSQSSNGHAGVTRTPLGALKCVTTFVHFSFFRAFLTFLWCFLGVSRDLVSFGSLLHELSQPG